MPLAAARRSIAAAGIMRALMAAGAPPSSSSAGAAAAVATTTTAKPRRILAVSPSTAPPPTPPFRRRAWASLPASAAAARAANEGAATAPAVTSAEAPSVPAASATASAAPSPPPPAPANAPQSAAAWPHVPVLLDEVLAAFAPPFRPPRTYVDGTLGAGGHASAVLAAHAGRGLRLLVGVDVDPAAHAIAGPRLAGAAEAAAAAAQEAASAAEEGADGTAPAARPPRTTIRLLRGNHSDISRLLAEVEWPADELGPHPSDAGGDDDDRKSSGSAGGKSSKKGRSLLGGVDAMLLDLGVSSMQIDDAGRGFSFVRDGPLDMRMAREAQQQQEQGEQGGGPSAGGAPSSAAATDALVGAGTANNNNNNNPATTPAGGLTAADIVNTWSEAALAELIRDYGEEKMWRRVAARIVRARDERGPLTTTAQLAAAIGRTALSSRPSAGGGRKGSSSKSDIHPATRTFQALRIAVNDELGGLARAVPAAIAALAPGGRLAVISFHSLEDRVVKHAMLRAAGKSTPEDEAAMAAAGAARGAEGEAWRLGREAAAVGRVLTRRPVLPGDAETALNPRARSAKLRVFEKFGAVDVVGGEAGGGNGVVVGQGAVGPAAAGGAAGARAGGDTGRKKATHRSKKWRELDEQQQEG